MTRISTFCAVSGALAVLALSANGASAGTLVPATPKVTVNAVKPNNAVKPKTPQAQWGCCFSSRGSGKASGTTSGTKQ